MYDIIVIGGGAAGMTSALYALRNSKSVLVLESESLGGQIATSPRLENFPSIKAISGEQFADNLFEQITSMGADFEIEKAVKIEKKDDGTFTVYTEYKQVSGIIGKVVNGDVSYVLVLYCINLAVVTADLAIYYVNKKRESIA